MSMMKGLKFWILFWFLFSIGRLYAAEYNFQTHCEWTQPVGEIARDFPLNQQTQIPVPLVYQAEANQVEFDFSNVFKIALSDPIIGKRCVRTLIRMDMTDLVEDSCSINTTRTKQDECIEASLDNILESDRLLSKQREENGSGRSGQTINLDFYPGEVYFGDKIETYNEYLRDHCGKANLNRAMLSQTMMQGHLPQILEEVDLNCRTKILDYYQRTLTNEYERALELKKGSERERRLNGINLALDELFKIYGHYTSDFTYEQMSFFRCQQDDNVKLALLNQAMEQIADEFSCLEYPAGEEDGRIIDLSGRENPTGLSARFKVKREGNNYHVTVPVRFDDSENSSEVNPEYRMLANGCFEEYRDVLVDSKGRQLNIKIADVDGMSPNRVSVIRDDFHRSNSAEWNHGIDCETVIHEVFHLLGLCDEYKERVSGYIYDEQKKGFVWVEKDAEYLGKNCRALGPTNSIMSHQDLALNGSVVYIMKCANEDFCSDKKSTASIDQYEKMKKSFEMLYEVNPESFGSPLEFIEIERIPPAGLSATHMDAILYPGCKKRNHLYYECSKSSRLTAIDHEDFFLKECPELPPQCRDGNTEWIKQ